MSEANDIHAEFSPSRLKQIMLCPGSVQLTRKAAALKRISLGQCEAAALGTNRHKLIEEYLSELYEGIRPFRGDVEEHFADLDEDPSILCDAVDYYCDLMEEFPPDNLPAFEVPVTLAPYDIPEVYGTVDYTWVSGDTLHVLDWKFGRWAVSPFKNPQLLAYFFGCLAAHELSAAGDIASPTKGMLHIVQPTIGNFARWEFTIAEEEGFLAKTAEAIEHANSENPPFFPGVDSCQWCKVTTMCSFRMQQAQENAQAVFAALEEEPALWDEQQIRDFLDASADVVAQRKKVLDFFENRLRQGHQVDGYKLVYGQGRRYWINDDKVVEFFDANYPQVEVMEAKMLSPSALEKLIPPKARRSEEFLALIGKTAGIKMVKDTEKGEPVGAQAAFASFKETDNGEFD
jgi:hypothetical protein